MFSKGMEKKKMEINFKKRKQIEKKNQFSFRELERTNIYMTK